MGTEGLQDRYINPYTDFGFKLLFGTDMNKDLLVSFLNALLFGKEEIKKVSYLNTEHLGRAAVFQGPQRVLCDLSDTRAGASRRVEL